MSLADQVLAINIALQTHMRENGIHALTGDEAAKIVSSAGILSHEQGTPPALAFRQVLSEVRDQYGYTALFQVFGAKQRDNNPDGNFVLLRFDPPSREKLQEILKSDTTETIDQPEQSVPDFRPDYLQDGLEVVFVGIAEAGESAKRDHYYADPGDKFWELVNQAGLISDLVGAENQHLVLDEKCGLTDLAKKNTLSPDPTMQTADVDVEGFVRKIEQHKPRIVAFNGKEAFKGVFAEDPEDYGLADDIIGDSYVFVLPSSSEADTSLAFKKKLHWYKKLHSTLKAL